jgi:hypothetical protein
LLTVVVMDGQEYIGFAGQRVDISGGDPAFFLEKLQPKWRFVRLLEGDAELGDKLIL